MINWWFGAWFGIPFRLPLRNNPFHKGIPKEIQTTGTQTINPNLWLCHGGFTGCDLSLVLTLHQKVQQGICVDNRFSEVGHHANEVGVPLVCNLGERPDAQKGTLHIVNPPYRLEGSGASCFTYWIKRKVYNMYICIMLMLHFSLASNQNTFFQKPTNPQSETLNQLPRYVEPEAIRIVRHLCFLNHPDPLMWTICLYACIYVCRNIHTIPRSQNSGDGWSKAIDYSNWLFQYAGSDSSGKPQRTCYSHFPIKIQRKSSKPSKFAPWRFLLKKHQCHKKLSRNSPSEPLDSSPYCPWKQQKLHLFSNCFWDSLSTFKKACAVISWHRSWHGTVCWNHGTGSW